MTRVVANRAFSVEADADRLDLRAWHETSWWRPAVAFALTFGIWAAAIMIGLWTDRLVVRAVMVLPLSVASGQLFTLAHDAGHGSYSTSRAVNALVGRLALIPSVHVYELWREHHNIHHRYTNLRSRDFVWTPLSVDEYGALSPGLRALHRICRNKSSLGLGLQYAIEIWAPRMLWPRRHHDLTDRGWLWADTVWLYASLIGLCVSAWGFVSVVEEDPRRHHRARRPGPRSLEIFKRQVSTIPRLRESVEGRADFELHATTYTPFRYRNPIDQNWLLVGDAAAMVDPLTSSGVTSALRHADLAARTLSDALERGKLTRRQAWAFRNTVPAMVATLDHAIDTFVYRPAVRRRLGLRWAINLYAGTRVITNSLYAKINPVTPPRALACFALLISSRL